jgi:hypothetical protein
VHRAARRRRQLQDQLDATRRGLAQCLAAVPELQRAATVATSTLHALLAVHRRDEAKLYAQLQAAQAAVEEMRRHIVALAGADAVPEEG